MWRIQFRHSCWAFGDIECYSFSQEKHYTSRHAVHRKETASGNIVGVKEASWGHGLEVRAIIKLCRRI